MHRDACKDIVEWDIENWSPALDYWRRHSAVDLTGCAALEIGSRHGGLSLWLALCGAHVVCSDVDGPSEAAVRKHERYGVAGRVRYERIDAVNVPYENAFDLVVFKSVLGGIGGGDRQRRAVREMRKALRTGGELWFAENLDASPLHRALRQRYVRWASHWRYLSIADLHDYLAPFQTSTFESRGVLGAFGRTETQRSLLGRLDTLVVNAIVPTRWRYIAIGVARK